MKSKEITYYMFGSEICSAYIESGIEQAIEVAKTGDFSIFKFDSEETTSKELLYSFAGWGDYMDITEEEYLQLSKI